MIWKMMRPKLTELAAERWMFFSSHSFKKTLKEKNIGILITDHNVHETLAITDRAYLMFEGSILKAGTAEDLAQDEQVWKVYLGQNFELR